MVLKITGYSKEEIAFVGDRIYTDVATGVNNGAKGFLVLTGEADMPVSYTHLDVYKRQVLLLEIFPVPEKLNC